MRSRTPSDGVASTTTSTGAVCSRAHAPGRAAMRSSDAKSYQEGFAARAERELPASGDWRILVAMRIKLEQTSCSDEERESGQRYPGVRPLVVPSGRAATRLRDARSGEGAVAPRQRRQLRPRLRVVRRSSQRLEVLARRRCSLQAKGAAR